GPVEANYPQWAGGKPSRSWSQFGYPIGYVTDILQNLEVLASLGCGADPRVVAGGEYLLTKQDAQGRWKMEYTYNGKTWVDVEQKGKPSKWITLRVLRFLKAIS
ncbi:MAG: nitrogen fixation protein NifH, partial [Anaerolineaceae bacterium]|nr:nitrogen fixation protein NifH [Anaerolineaceae bacterium]